MIFCDSGTTLRCFCIELAERLEKNPKDIRVYTIRLPILRYFQRYKRIPEDTDYCTLLFGINDSVHSELGKLGDTEPTTFYGAWDTVFRWILTNRPMMKTGVIVSNDCPREYREATVQSARRWSIPYLDLMGDDKVPMITKRDESLGDCSEAEKLRSEFFCVSAENDHPNLNAHLYESYFIENFLKSL